MTRKVTIYSIAQDLKVHPSTVSRAFSRPDLVRDDVRDRILAWARVVDYQPNRAARSLVTGRTGMVGLVTPDIENPFFPPLIRVLQKAAAEHELGVILLDTELHADRELDLLARLHHQVDGFVIASPMSSTAKIAEAVNGRPTVLLNRGTATFSSAVIDNTTALREAADLLTRLGHRRIALLRGPVTSWASQRRADAVHRWAAAARADLVDLGAFDAAYAGGLAATVRLAGTGVTAALAFDDLMACGVVAGLAEQGVRVPDDFSLVGCDDVLLSRVLTPALTTLAAPIDELGCAAIDLLTEQITDKTAKPRSERLFGRLVVRGSTGPAPGRQPTFLFSRD